MKSDSRGEKVAHILYFERLLNEGFIENDATESPREGGSKENNHPTRLLTRVVIH
jgi:hypothetical protein